MSGAWPDPPAGFVLRAEGATALYVDRALEGHARRRGLGLPEGWETALLRGSPTGGRGATVVVGDAQAPRWRLKRMRRGGLLAPAWRDRYPAAGRLVATLAASVEAAARGVPTARPVALLVRREPLGLARGAMAFEEIEGAEALGARLRRGGAVPEEIAAVMQVVRAMHERGVCHPDLNLGNILVRPRPGAPPEISVVDLDRADFRDGPLPFAAREAAVRRMERSCAKTTGSPGPFGTGSEDLWYTAYAAGDTEMAQRLAAGRRAGRWRLALHRLGWR